MKSIRWPVAALLVVVVSACAQKGPKGDTGPQGDPGAQGTPGQPGVAGTPGLVWRGAWSASTAYAAGDAVSSQGSAYIATAPSTGVQPPGTGWDLLAAMGQAGQAWTASTGLVLNGTDLSVDPVFVTSTVLADGFLKLDSAASPPAQSGNFTTNGTATIGTSVSTPTVNADNYLFRAPHCGGENLGSLDFQPTVTGSGNVVRSYDEFGVDTAGAKIGATVHPYNGATPIEFTCWFQTSSSGNPGTNITATLWQIPPGGGGVAPGPSPIASVSLDGSTPTTAPTAVTTSTFSIGNFVTFDGASGFRYIVEVTSGFTWPTFKASGCTVRWCTKSVSP